jgi:hypothetical protein
MTGGRIVAIVVGVLGVLLGAAAIAATISILVEDRDADDFFISSEQRFERSSFAIASEDVDVLTDAPGWLTDWLVDPVDVRVRGASGDDGAVFFGIADSGDRDAYLAGVNYDEVTSIDFRGDDITYRTHEGTAVPSPPGAEGIWVASVEGTGEQTLDWSLETGNWSVVVMNADASAGIDATLVFGAKVFNLILLAWIGLALGVLFVAGGGYLLYRGFRRQS